MNTHAVEDKITDPQVALQLLKEGNKRYVSGNLSSKDSYAHDREFLQNGQQPYAIVLSCSDSRVSPELIFDQGLGDLFVIRTGGNIIDDTTLASIHLGIEHLHTPLIVVCGHTRCAAVTEAMNEHMCNRRFAPLIKYISAAIQHGDTIDQVSRRNAFMSAELLRSDEYVQHCGTKVMAALYDVVTGEVHWLDEEPNELEDLDA